MRAGCAGAFIARPGVVLDPLAPKPDIIGADLREVAEQILQLEG
jgi:2-haloacid dehalogenase